MTMSQVSQIECFGFTIEWKRWIINYSSRRSLSFSVEFWGQDSTANKVKLSKMKNYFKMWCIQILESSSRFERILNLTKWKRQVFTWNFSDRTKTYFKHFQSAMKPWNISGLLCCANMCSVFYVSALEQLIFLFHSQVMQVQHEIFYNCSQLHVTIIFYKVERLQK